jgi:hypothetical protein
VPIAAQAAVGVVDHDAADGDEGLLWRVYSYATGPLVVGDGWRRRRYVRGGAAIDVTVARQQMTDAEYAEWRRQASNYPTAPFDASFASGFFTCAGDAASAPCDLHVQTSGGWHLELTGGEQATRPDLERLFLALHWK